MQVSAEDAPVIKLVYSILGQAVGEGASDIHFEPDEDGDAGPLPGRRRPPRGRARAEADGQRGDLAGEDHERPQHRRETRAPGRPRQRHRRGPPGRPPHHHAADPARRGGDDPHPRQGQRPALARRPRHGRRPPASASSSAFQQAYGAVLVTGPTGSGKSTTLYAALQELNHVEKKIITIEDPVEYQIDGHQPDQRQPQGRPRLRHRAALDPPRRPRHRHGRRDPRRRDGADRDRGGADRAHDALDPAHQRRPGRDHPPDQDGDRVLPDRLGGRLRRRPAPGAEALQPLQAARRDPGPGADRGRAAGRGRAGGLRAGRLRPLQPQRLQRPRRPLLGDDPERADQGDGRRPARRRRRSPPRRGKRGC